MNIRFASYKAKKLAAQIVQRICAIYQYNCPKNGEDLKIGTWRELKQYTHFFSQETRL